MTTLAPPVRQPIVRASRERLARVLLVHNRYQHPGGEDTVFEAERDLLLAHGHEVETYEVHNDEVDGLSRAALAARTLWSRPAAEAVRQRAEALRADVVHFHNTLPLVSPAGYYAAREAGAAVVQTLHNYRLVCPSATLFREGTVCTDCVGKTLSLPGIRHACYRESRAATAAVAGMVAAHRAAGTWCRAVDRYIALTEFARDLFVDNGLPAERVAVKPNFLATDPGASPVPTETPTALFIGRLAPGKGVETMLAAWASLPDVGLRVLGDGPLAPLVHEAAAERPHVEALGWQSRERVLEELGAATFLVMPSEWFEGMPLTLVEAFALGRPAVASDLGAMRSMVRHQTNGRLFSPGDPDALAHEVRAMVTDPDAARAMGRAARKDYERLYSAQAAYRGLADVYADARRQRDAA